MTASPKYFMTLEEYLAFERSSDTKHEYIDGEIYAMAGARAPHNIITANIGALLHAQRRAHTPPCLIYSSDQSVKASANTYFYPDVTVVCAEPIYEPTGLDTLLNPTLIVEVLSPSTEQYDRRKKSLRYQNIESLQEYLFVAQDAPWIERYRRQPDGTWQFSGVIGRDSMVELVSINATLALADIYENVTFETEE